MKTKEEFKLYVRRMSHMITNDRCVVPIVANVLNAAQSPSPLPAPFATIFAGANNFAGLTEGSLLTTGHIKRMVAIARNSGAPGAFGKLYAMVIDNAGLTQLSDDDDFLDVVKRHADMTGKALKEGDMIDWGGVRFVLQDDAYRCELNSEGGALTTRKNTGKVHVAHLLGKGAMGYVDFGGKAGKDGSTGVQRRTLMPKFKVQDLSKTGTSFTIGWRIPFQACVLNNKRGLNIAYCSNYDETIDELIG
jgi:N4-gp56 family major capsid protein